MTATVLNTRARSVARPSGAVTATISAAWLTLLAADASGVGDALHHHALAEGGPPLWVAVPVFLVAWQVMVAAMMLPASLPAIEAIESTLRGVVRPGQALVTYLAAFGLVWAVFGLAAFLGDVVLHRTVDATPWLAERPWLIEAGVIAVAGAYQFAPLKRRSLATCRHPGSLAARAVGASAARVGLCDGLACLGSSWALMLLMFGEGLAGLGWMVALTAVMAYETSGRHGQRVARLIGAILLLAALGTLSGTAGPATSSPSLP